MCAGKKEGGIRPIAVGCTLRRLVSKMACRSEFSNTNSKLRPKQIGVATKGGCEAAVHSVRTYLSHHENSNKVLVKVDLRNAFNSVERDDLLHSILQFTPNIFKFFYQCYHKPSILFFGDYRIASQVGVQQGDPSGPLIFSLAIQPIIEELKSELNVWFLDDGTIAGNMETVLNDLKIIKEKFAAIGLEVNTNKCEIFQLNKNENVFKSFSEIMPGIRLVEDLTLLGAPIVLSAGEIVLQEKEKELELFFNRLPDLNQHVAYFLLKHCLGIPKLTYLIRTTPFWKFPEIVQRMDLSIKLALESICNTKIDDYQHTIATLPCRLGGLGIRKIEDIIYPAFLSSVVSTSGLINEMLSTCAIDLPDIAHYNDGLSAWTLLGNSFPEETHRQFQREWDEINISRITSILNFPSPSHEARYRASLKQESSLWLNVIPSKHIGTLLDNHAFRISIAIRLGSEMCHPFQCVCGVWVDAFGTHGLCCKKSGGRHSRHSELNNIINRGLSTANIPSSLEPKGLFRDDGKKPDGMTLIPWSKGQCIVWDATCVDTLAKSYIDFSKSRAGYAAERAANMKINKYKKLQEQNYLIIPFAVETIGPWCSEAIKFTNELGKLMSKATGEQRAKLFFMQNISLAIQRGNAASIMKSYPKSESMNEIFYII